MPPKLDMTNEERVAHIRKQNRERASAYYKRKMGETEFIENRMKQRQPDKELLKAIPPPPRSKTAPATATPPVQKQPAQVDKDFLMIKGLASYNKMTVEDVITFMKENRNFVIDKQKNEPLSDSSFKDYMGRMKTFFKDLGITDNVVRDLLKVDNVIEKIKKINKFEQKATAQKLITIIFSVLRSLVRGGLINVADDKKLQEIYKKYDTMYKVQIVKRIIEDKEITNNPEYAVPSWTSFEKIIKENYTEKNSIQYLITVLYRYNAVRNDFSLPITFKQPDADSAKSAFYIDKGIVRVVKNDHKTAEGHGVIDFTYPKNASTVIINYIKSHKLKEGDKLLPKSINDIAKDMFDKAGIVIPPKKLAVSVFRKIDSAMKKGATLDPEEIVRKAGIHKHSPATMIGTYGYVQREDPPENVVVSTARATRASTKKK